MIQSKIKTQAQIYKIMRQAEKGGKKVVFTNGCFDILHLGHIRYLQNAKNIGDLLIIALNSDRSVRLNKGALRPLIPEMERAEMLSALSFVDYVFIFDDQKLDKILEIIKPPIYVKGSDYNIQTIVQSERRIIEAYGGKIQFVRGTDEHATSNLINQIINQQQKCKPRKS